MPIMTTFWQNFLIRCGIAALCGAAYTSLAISQAWFSSVPDGPGDHFAQIAAAAVMGGVAAAMVYGLEYALTPDLSTIMPDRTGPDVEPPIDAMEG